ncbi:MAG TPA: hypothetical protein PKY59_14890 [Pyrinomonadaceae bacterium]|nr:hypothetical protein [Pyrinomonadaceae bacterium]
MKEVRKEKSFKQKLLSVTLFSLIFGIFIGTFFATMCGFFVPVVFPNWAGKFVCEGRMVYQNLQEVYLCYTSETVSYELGTKVFWTMFKLFVAPCLALSFIILFAFYGLIEFVLGKNAEIES